MTDIDYAQSGKGTRLCQIKISDMSKAAAIFSEGNEVKPLVLVPKGRSIFSFVMNVPSDVYVLMQKNGKHVPEGSPHWEQYGMVFKPPWWRVAYLVTRQAVTYDAPVAAVPTKDNIPVEVDITLVFSISDPQKFVYDLGVLRFDAYLKAATDESIRMLVRDVYHYDLLDMKGEFGVKMLDSLNEKFEPMGVRFTTVLVPNVKLPEGLVRMRENITGLNKSREIKQRDHEFNIKKLEDDSALALQRITQENSEQLMAIEASIEQAKIERNQRQADLDVESQDKTLEAQESLKVAEINAEASYNQAILKAEKLKNTEISKAEKKSYVDKSEAKFAAQRALTTAEQYKTELLHATEAQCREEELTTAAKAQQMELSAQAKFTEAELTIQSTLLAGEAEAKAADAFKARRQHEIDMQKMEIQGAFAAQGRVMIKGNNADKFMNSMCQMLIPEVSSSAGSSRRS